MARGKASVQFNHHLGDVLTQFLDDTSNVPMAAGEDGQVQKQCVAEAETDLGEHVAEQLRAAYAELLNEPIPDHLNKLLATLCKVEGKS